MLEIIGSWIISFILSLRYFGIFILMTLESALVPIPSEVTMPFSGSLVVLGKLNFWLIILAGTIGNLIGSLLAYGLGWWGQETIVRKIINQYGKYLLISEHEYDHAERWFRNHGELIVFLSRVLPIIRTYISLPAGVAKMNLIKFIAYTSIGSIIWCYFLTSIGMVLGNNWKLLEGYFHKFDIIIVILIILFVLWYLKHKIQRIKKIN